MANVRPFRLAYSIAIPLLVGFLGSLFTAPSIDAWYRFLAKPAFAPPDWVFGPVWTALYILMGVAAYLAAEHGAAMTPYWIQLSLNGLWTPLFFGLRSPVLGLTGITVLWAFIIVTMRSFYRAHRVAAYLLIPYLAWVAFAVALNLSIAILNP